eukprot:TRINITY_DN910_c0_g1_i1.p1 TRINITY_DN910_c0_g1~~TRINITY_DN910_c0_g1_i1.p1  ORF type:complete len:218 (+),score=38.60 TRINITY_DN910_c0_g1_i1:93-746(+)
MKAVLLIVALFTIISTVACQGVPYGTCYNKTLDQMLIDSSAMPAQIVALSVAIPFNTLWDFFVQAQYWVWWNPLFETMYTTNFTLCGRLHAAYSNAPKFPSPLNITNSYHHIIQMGKNPSGKVGAFAWFFAADSNEGSFYGRHTYTIQDAGNGGSILESWERAAGPLVERYSVVWTAALQESLLDGITGAVCLERVYQTTGGLNPNAVFATCDPFTP